MLRRVIGRERRFGFWDYAALFPVAFFPHFLNCLSYKYDAPYMALSIGVSIAPLLFRRCRRSVYCAGVFTGTLAMCMLYQASSGIFPVIVAYLVMTGDPAGRSGEKKPGDGGDHDGRYGRGIRKEETRSRKRRAGFLRPGLLPSTSFAMVFFRLFIMQPLSDYVSTELAEPGALFSVLAGNYREYFRLFFSDLRLPWLVLLALITALFLVDRIVRAKGSRVVAFFLTLAGTACMFLFCLGAYPFLAKPLFQPRAMYGLGFPFILMGLQLCLEEGRQWAGKLAVLALSFCFFVFSYVYGNALDVQARYTDFRAGAAIADLTALEEFAGDGERCWSWPAISATRP